MVTEIQYILEIIICDPSIYSKLEHPVFVVSNLMVNSIGLKRVNLLLFRIDSTGVSVFDNSDVLYAE